MPLEFAKFAFTAGELSEELHGRGDLEGFRFGFREGLNVLVDWRGGLRTRPGTLMHEPLFEDSANPGFRLSTFSFNTDAEDNYLLIWKHKRLYFLQEGQYLYTSQPRLGGASLLDGFAVGDIVLVFTNFNGGLGDFLFTGQVKDENEVYVPYADDTVTLTDAAHRVVRAYSIPTLYDHEDLHDLKFDQFRDDITITHQGYTPYILRRTLLGGLPIFNLLTITFLNPRAVENKTATERNRTDDFASNEGGMQWTVAVVDEDGVEHPLNYSDAILSSGVDIGDKYLELTWDADANAEFYRIYSSLFVPDFDEEPDGVATAADSMPSLPSLANYSGTVGTEFSQTLPVASGGDGELTYSFDSGAVPGLTFDPDTRVLSGNPSAAGTYNIVYEVEDEDGDTAQSSFAVVIAAASDPGDVVPGRPTGLTATGQTTDTISLEWVAPTTGDPPSRYRVRYSTNSTLSDSDPTQTFTEVEGTLTGLALGTRYWIQVRAENGGGNSSYTGVIQVVTAAELITRNTQKDINLGGNSWEGAAGDDSHIWFLSSGPNPVWARAYIANTRVRDTGEDTRISTSSGPRNHASIMALGNYLYSGDYNNNNGQHEVFRTTKGSTGGASQYNIVGDIRSFALATDGTTVWIGNIGFLRAYTAASFDGSGNAVRSPINDIPLASPHSPDGAAIAGNFVWVVFNDESVECYNISTKVRSTEREPTLPVDDNQNYRGACYADGTIWFVDDGNDIAIAYDLG